MKVAGGREVPPEQPPANGLDAARKEVSIMPPCTFPILELVLGLVIALAMLVVSLIAIVAMTTRPTREVKTDTRVREVRLG